MSRIEGREKSYAGPKPLSIGGLEGGGLQESDKQSDTIRGGSGTINAR